MQTFYFAHTPYTVYNIQTEGGLEDTMDPDEWSQMNVGTMSRKKLYCVENRNETKVVPLCGKLFHPLRNAQYPIPSGISSVFTFLKANQSSQRNSS